MILTKEKKPISSRVQRKFNQLREKIKTLQENQKKTVEELDASLQFYYAEIYPIEKKSLKLLIERTELSYQFYITQNGLSKSEFKSLKNLIIRDVNIICSLHDDCNIPAEIKKIFKELHGTDYDVIAAEKQERFKNSMKEMFSEYETDIDFSDLDKNQSAEKIMDSASHSMDKFFEEKENSNQTHKESKKTNKRQEKELKEKTLVERQKKSISSIYKKLVFALHPDLEQDNKKKIWKEELVKKITSAYHNNDLYALLAIEMDWANHSTGQTQSQTDAQFEIYNAILRDQIKTLESDIDTLLMDQKYTPIEKFYDDYFDGISALKRQRNLLKEDLKMSQKVVAGLKTPNAAAIYRETIKIKRRQLAEEENYFF